MWLQFLSVGFWSGVCLLFSLFVISNFWPGVVAIPGFLLCVVLSLTRLKHLMTMWLLGAPTLFIFANNLLSDVPLLRVERVLLPLSMIGLLVDTLSHGKRLKSPIAVEKAMLALLLVAGTSTFYASWDMPTEVIKGNVVLYIQGLLLPYFAFFITRQITWHECEVELLFHWLFIAGCYLVVVGALQLFLGIHFFYPQYLEPPKESDRATGVFPNPTEYGLVLTAFMYLALFLFARAKDGIMRALYIGAMLVFAVGLGISKTRAPWVGAMVGLLVIFLNDKRTRGLMTIGGIIAFCGLLAAMPLLINSGLIERRLLDLEPMFPRLAAYMTALNIIGHNPLTGLGFGPLTFAGAKPEYGTTFDLISAQWTLFASVPHNEFLHMLVLTGLTGFVPFILVLRGALRITHLSASRNNGDSTWQADFAVYGRAIIFAYLCAALFVDVLFFNYFLFLMYALLGILASFSPVEVRHSSAPLFQPSIPTVQSSVGKLTGRNRPPVH